MDVIVNKEFMKYGRESSFPQDSGRGASRSSVPPAVGRGDAAGLLSPRLHLESLESVCWWTRWPLGPRGTDPVRLSLLGLIKISISQRGIPTAQPSQGCQVRRTAVGGKGGGQDCELSAAPIAA